MELLRFYSFKILANDPEDLENKAKEGSYSTVLPVYANSQRS